jgi:hypothetical protein
MPTHGRTDSPNNYQTNSQQENQDKQSVSAKRTTGASNRYVRVRVKRLEQIDEDKIELAYWLLAKAIVENKSAQEVTDEEARRVAQEFDGDPGPASRARGRK